MFPGGFGIVRGDDGKLETGVAMSAKRARLRYWALDIRQFVFWFSVAFMAGAGPNVAQLVHPVALVGLGLVSAGVAFGLWYQNHRKKGDRRVHTPGPLEKEFSTGGSAFRGEFLDAGATS